MNRDRADELTNRLNAQARENDALRRRGGCPHTWQATRRGEYHQLAHINGHNVTPETWAAIRIGESVCLECGKVLRGDEAFREPE